MVHARAKLPEDAAVEDGWPEVSTKDAADRSRQHRTQNTAADGAEPLFQRLALVLSLLRQSFLLSANSVIFRR